MLSSSRKCIGCLQIFTCRKFYRKPALVDGFDKRCKKCRYKIDKCDTTLRSRRDFQLKKKYGINQKIYNDMLIQQNRKCKICDKRFRSRLFVDHDHKTGKVRGLLCNNCNKALGLLYDSVSSLKRAFEYLYENQIRAAEVMKKKREIKVEEKQSE